MDVNGANVREIAKGYYPAHAGVNWFRDNKRICYASGHKIYVVDVNTGEIKEITDGIQPAVSPDGSKIIYLKRTLVKDAPLELRRDMDPSIQPNVWFGTDVYIVNSDGSGLPKNLTNNPLNNPLVMPHLWKFDDDPRWIDNKRIQFYSGHKRTRVIITLE
jgi:Tol biopolymer transport system component